jgi:hypothetical protein
MGKVVPLAAFDGDGAAMLPQFGASNPQAQGFQHLVLDGHASQDASSGNTALMNALRNAGDLLNVFGDFPTLKDPRHADAYSPNSQFPSWHWLAVTGALFLLSVVAFALWLRTSRPSAPPECPAGKDQGRHDVGHRPEDPA